jgi:serine protein kinase
MLFSFAWKNEDGTWAKDPMHGEPLQLVPEEQRAKILAMLNENSTKPYHYDIKIKGDLCPYSRYEFKQRIAKYDGDWLRMLDQEVKVYRLILSEKDRVGIGTFQPKDEKNQDSTELTGDINYRKIAEYVPTRIHAHSISMVS